MTIETAARPPLTTLYDPDIDECTRCGRGEDGCVCGHLPYVELFVHEEDAQHPELTWRWICNVCGIKVGRFDRVHCPEHVPGEIPGLVMAECFLDGRSHPRVWFPASDNDYGHPCPYCMLAQATEAHDECRHSTHRPWRRWKSAHRAVRVLSRLRLVDAVSYSFGHGCQDCVTFGWRRAQ